MQIEAGKFYTTRNGRKVGPMAATVDNRYWPFKCDGYFFKTDGFSCPGHLSNHHPADDLVAEVRRPKVGDRVRILDGAIGHARPHVGEVVEVIRIQEQWNGTALYFKNDLRNGFESCLIDGEWDFAATAAYPDTTSAPGDIVEVVAERYGRVPVGSLGRVTATCGAGLHVRMCDDGLSYVFGLDEIAKTDELPEYEHEAGDSAEFGQAFDDYESDLRDDIAAETLALIIENEGADVFMARDHDEIAFAYADAFIAARAV